MNGPKDEKLIKPILLDLDTKEVYEQVKEILYILGITFWGRKSSTKGWHIKIDCWRPYRKETALKIRYMFGDDYGRYVADVRRLQHGTKTFNLLFAQKNNKKAGEWVHCQDMRWAKIQ